MVKVLLAAKADVNATDAKGNTPLIKASARGDINLVESLLKSGADVNIANKIGETALIKSVDKSQLGELKNIVTQWEGYPEFLRKVAQKQMKLVTLLIEAGANVNATDKNGNTALTVASSIGEAWNCIVQALLSAGAKTISQPVQINSNPNKQSTCVINTPDQFGETPLLTAVKKGQIDEVKNLIAQGADVNFVNSFKESVLMFAVKKNQLEIVKLLIEAGADANYKDNFGKSILKTAEQKGYTEIVELLESAGAKE